MEKDYHKFKDPIMALALFQLTFLQRTTYFSSLSDYSMFLAKSRSKLIDDSG